MNNYDEEEREIITAFEASKLKSTQPSRELLERHRSYARGTMSKEKLTAPGAVPQGGFVLGDQPDLPPDASCCGRSCAEHPRGNTYRYPKSTLQTCCPSRTTTGRRNPGVVGCIPSGVPDGATRYVPAMLRSIL